MWETIAHSLGCAVAAAWLTACIVFLILAIVEKDQ